MLGAMNIFPFPRPLAIVGKVVGRVPSAGGNRIGKRLSAGFVGGFSLLRRQAFNGLYSALSGRQQA